MTSTTSVTSSSSAAGAVVAISGTTSTTGVSDSTRVETIASRVETIANQARGAPSAATTTPHQSHIGKYVVLEPIFHWPWVSRGSDPYTNIGRTYGGF